MVMRLVRAMAVAVAVMLGLSGPAMADKFEEVTTKGVIRIGIPADLPPFGFQNANREPVGFDIDLANMLAASLGVKVEFVPLTGANRIPFLLTDKVDMTVSLMGLTPQRAKQVWFSAPYASTSLAVFGPKSIAVTSAAELKDYKVSAAKGNTEETSLTEMNPKANILRMENDAAAAAAYLSGQADLFACSSFIAVELGKQNTAQEFDLKFVIRPSPGHMAVRQGESRMLEWINSFIFFNKINGELNKLHIKWLGRPMDPLPTL
ncbi:MAG: transporter substrate-binding domain-containing protein [Alphaproteobacteria bacterium]|nr:transporter substrate-binding domain-containing protein [Alphaproteobacteria bacterium]